MLFYYTHRSDSSSRSMLEWVQRPIVRHYADNASQLEISIGSLHSEITETCKSGKYFRSQGYQRTAGEHGPPNQLSRVHIGSQRLKRRAQGVYLFPQVPLFMLQLVEWYFCGTSNSSILGVSDSFACPYKSSPSIVLPCEASI